MRTDQSRVAWPGLSRLTALPIRLSPPVHADPLEPTQGCIRLHALALGAGVLLGAPTGHTCLIVGLRGHHAVAFSQVPLERREKDTAFNFLGLLPRRNST